jgi:hypothetical protein
MCVKNGVVEGTPGNLDERIAAVGPVGPAGLVGGVGPVGILTGVVREDSIGPLGPKTSALIAALEASARSDYEAARKAYIAGGAQASPSPCVSKLRIRRASLDALVATIEFLDHQGEAPVRQCEMPDGTTALGLSGDHVMDFLVSVLGSKACTKLRIGGARDSWANLLVMPGMYKNGKGTKFNNIHKRQATVSVEYVRHCDMCGTAPSKSVQQNGACGAPVIMPGGEKVDLFVCLGELHCPTGPVVVRGHVVQVEKNLNRHSARAKLASCA